MKYVVIGNYVERNAIRRTRKISTSEIYCLDSISKIYNINVIVVFKDIKRVSTELLVDSIDTLEKQGCTVLNKNGVINGVKDFYSAKAA